MKNLRTIQSKLLVMLILVFGIAIVQSCKKEDDPIPVIKTALLAKITEANTLIGTAEEGTASGQYTFGSKAALQVVIDIAQAVYDDASATQIAVDNSVGALTAAITVFDGQAIVPIAPDALVGHWPFDDGSGTTAKDYSDNGFNGTFGNESGFGTGAATWTTDRYGNVGKAIAFDKGAKITVPYNSKLNPGQMTISLWINAAEIRENNRFMGLQSWLGYKYQLQSLNKAYFTGYAGNDIWIEDDTEPVLNLNKWYHIAVTVGGGKLILYTNGIETRNLDKSTAALATVVGHDLVFGVGSSKYAATDTNYDVDKIIPIAWGGYFHGSLDEIRMYNTPLSATQIQSIYNVEKPQ